MVLPDSSLKAAERSAKRQMYREAEVMVCSAQKKEQPRGSSISKAAPVPGIKDVPKNQSNRVDVDQAPRWVCDALHILHRRT